MMTDNRYTSIPKEKFSFAQRETKLHDAKLQRKPIGYFKDAWMRFCANKSALVAFALIIMLVLFSIFVPLFSNYDVSFREGYYQTMLPKSKVLSKLGFWNGTKRSTENQTTYDYLLAVGKETNRDVVVKEYNSFENNGITYHEIRVDAYYKVGFAYINVLPDEYAKLMQYQNETGIQVIYPLAKTETTDFLNANAGANFWYKLKDESRTSTGTPLFDENGDFIPNYITSDNKEKAGYTSLRIEGDNGGEDGSEWYVYAKKNQTGYRLRVDYYNYFVYKNGFEPAFLFGTNVYGQDIFTCLAAGGRLSFLLSISVCLINFFIGIIYGSIEGYYGGTVDIIMERISDILNDVPFTVVAILFQLHLAKKVGVLPTLLFAYIMTGWVGMASRVRMQFYRFKGQEYVLAARTLGAGDMRIIFKHIFPNSLGTIVTGSVLAIPGVIFSESMLSYLHIINLETSSLTSIGTMLSNGQGYLSSFPHIILFPAIFISILEISFNLFGNGLRDAFNPSLRGANE